MSELNGAYEIPPEHDRQSAQGDHQRWPLATPEEIAADLIDAANTRAPDASNREIPLEVGDGPYYRNSDGTIPVEVTGYGVPLWGRTAGPGTTDRAAALAEMAPNSFKVSEDGQTLWVNDYTPMDSEMRDLVEWVRDMQL